MTAFYALLKVRNDVYIGKPTDLIKHDYTFVHKMCFACVGLNWGRIHRLQSNAQPRLSFGLGLYRKV